jgi:hypothetical protein
MALVASTKAPRLKSIFTVRLLQCCPYAIILVERSPFGWRHSERTPCARRRVSSEDLGSERSASLSSQRHPPAVSDFESCHVDGALVG